MLNPNCSTLVEGIGYFWPQNRILRVKLCMLATGNVYRSKPLKIRCLHFLNLVFLVFTVFSSFCKVLTYLERCGKQFPQFWCRSGPYWASWCRAMMIWVKMIFYRNFESYFFRFSWRNWLFLTAKSNSACKNPPRAHLHMSGNLNFGPTIKQNKQNMAKG